MTLTKYLVEIWQNRPLPQNARDLFVIDGFEHLIDEKRFQDIKYVLEDLKDHCKNVNDSIEDIAQIIKKKT